MKTINYKPPIQSWLRQELANKQIQNSNYSLRAFSRDIGLSKSTVSGVINGTRHLSVQSAEKLASRLSFSPKNKAKLLKEVHVVSELEFHQVAEDEFRLLSEWYYLAILNLAKISEAKFCEKWIAKRIAITQSEAKNALKRLERLNHIENVDGSLVRLSESISTTTDVDSSAIKRHQKQCLDLAKQALDETPIKLRECNSITFAVNPDQIEKAKEEIFKFRQRLCKILEKGEPSEVYIFSSQLYPISKNIKEKE
jgi:uncharacterized protein (TIGR02147 family)